MGLCLYDFLPHAGVPTFFVIVAALEVQQDGENVEAEEEYPCVVGRGGC